MKTALITGITGQDGSYLAELLLSKGYVVHGIVRRSSSFNTGRLEHIFKRLHLHFGDVTDGTSLRRVLTRVQPTEVYNLAAQSHVAVSFEEPELTHEIVAMGALRLFEACRDVVPTARVYQASSSEMFGGGVDLDENSPLRPRSPYAVAKVAAHWHAVNMREAYGMHISCGILFNHESARRGETFVTQKIARAAAERRTVVLGNLEARRDWGFAGDYVRAMWMMMQREDPDDFVIATGESRSVQKFAAVAYDRVGLNWSSRVQTNERYYRPNDVQRLQGNSSKARLMLKWEPTVTFEQLVHEMVDACAR
jgi:GDPmannose 4,6-dehydratase